MTSDARRFFDLGNVAAYGWLVLAVLSMALMLWVALTADAGDPSALGDVLLVGGCFYFAVLRLYTATGNMGRGPIAVW